MSYYSKDSFVYLFSNVKPVKGSKRSLICDLGRFKYDFIPNGLFDILIKNNGSKIDSIFSKFNEAEHSILDEYFKFLIEKEYVFLSKKKINLEFNQNLAYENPNKIISSIVDIDENSKHDLKGFFNQLNSVNCRNLQIRFFGNVSSDLFKSTIKLIKNTRLKYVQLIVSNFTIKENKINNLIDDYPRLKAVIMYGCKKNEKLSYVDSDIFLSTKNIISANQCGVIKPDFFAVNIENFGLSQEFNSCLYKKLSVDVKGNIKNCPSMKDSYGVLDNLNITEIINSSKFKKYDLITKDKVKVCKDCEFRYICTDCRVFIEDKDDLYSKPEKCNYNPYIAKWEN